VSNSVQRRAGDGISLTCLPPALQWLPSSGHGQMRSLHTSHCISLGPVRGLTGRQSTVDSRQSTSWTRMARPLPWNLQLPYMVTLRQSSTTAARVSSLGLLRGCAPLSTLCSRLVETLKTDTTHCAGCPPYYSCSQPAVKLPEYTS
jgi:hypothetical protein